MTAPGLTASAATSFLARREAGRPHAVARAERGFTYLGLMFAIVLMGVALAATGEVWHTASTREKERDLLFIGNQFRLAIASYYAANPPGQYPQRLDDLLKDPRQPGTVRHLRKIYVDPMTGKPEWGLVMAPSGGIMGVHSLSDAEPMKKANFRPADHELAGKSRYSGWVFSFAPNNAAAPGQMPRPGTTPARMQQPTPPMAGTGGQQNP